MLVARVMPAREEMKVRDGVNGPSKAGEARMYAEARRVKCMAEMRLMFMVVLRADGSCSGA